MTPAELVAARKQGVSMVRALRPALGNVQAYVWSRMGNAQRFSQPAE